MIVMRQCEFGQPLALHLEDVCGPRVQLECIEFMNQLPLCWRLVDAAGTPITTWKPGRCPGRPEPLSGLWDLQRPVSTGTAGTQGVGVTVETQGIGVACLMVWPRPGTFTESTCSN